MSTKTTNQLSPALISSLLCIVFISLALNNFVHGQTQPYQGVIISSSPIGSPVQFNKHVFSWTDRVNITIYAPDYVSDPNLIATIGNMLDNKLTVCTTGHCIPYMLAETGPGTGIFSGYVDLTGDPSQKGSVGVDGNGQNPTGIMSTCNPLCGPTDGMLPATGNDGISVSFEYTLDRTVTGSALIHWNTGQIQWLQPNYPSNGQGVLQIVDPDMSMDPSTISKFDTNVWSGSDRGGIKLTMTETQAGSGIFQGTVDFATQYPSSGDRLHVSNGDTVTGEYIDRTLPPPAPSSGEEELNATTTVGTVLPPLQRVLVSNARMIDSAGDVLDKIAPGQQVEIVSDVKNNMGQNQTFAYLVQIQDSNGIPLSLSWITGSLSADQNMSLSQSWIPESAGTYTAQVFVWQGITNPNALSLPLKLQIPVS